MKRVMVLTALLLALANTRRARANPYDCSDYGCGTGVGDVIGWIDGTAVKSNGSICTGTCGGPEQCVELVKDYFPSHFGISYGGYGAARNYFYNIGDRPDLKRYYNNGYDGPPQDGDAIVFDKSGTVGHIAMVRSRTSNSVEICQQNWAYGVDPCVDLPMTISSSGKVSVGSQGSYYVIGWVRAVKNGVPVSPPNGDPSGGGGSIPPPPTPTLTRAFALGQGTGTPEAWVEGYENAGGFNELGIPITSPAWDGNYVYQVFTRPETGIVSVLIHDQKHNVPYAWAIIDGFYAFWKSQGGMAVVGAPIDNKYDLGGGNYRQDYTNGYITNDSTGFHFWKNYPFGYTPGQGSANPGAFQFGYTQAGGNTFGNPTSAIFIKNGNEVQAYQTPGGKSVWMVLITGYSQAFGVSGVMYDAWMQSGNVFGGWGVPISKEYYIGPNQTMERFRYGTAYKNDKNVVAFTPTSPAGTKLYAPGEGMTPDHAAHIITAYERSGGVGKLGPCTAAYDINSYNYQYCSGGAYSGRAAVVLNYNWGGYVAVVVRGSIEAYWETSGGIGGPLGTPYTEEFPSVMMPGSQAQEFGHKIEQWYDYASHLSDYPYGYALGDGATYWSAFAIMRRYDGDKAGYPKTWIYWTGQGQAQEQLGGAYSGKVAYIHDSTSRAARAYLVKGGIGARWWALGGGNSYLGLPVTDEIVNGTRVTQYYQYGLISGDTTTGVYQDRKY